MEQIQQIQPKSNAPTHHTKNHKTAIIKNNTWNQNRKSEITIGTTDRLFRRNWAMERIGGWIYRAPITSNQRAVHNGVNHPLSTL